MPTKFAMRLLAGTAISALITGAAVAADAQARPYDIPQQDAATALQAFAMQSGKQLLFPYEAAKGKQAPEIKGDYSDEEVLALLAASAGLKVTADDGRTITLRPQFAQTAGGGGGATVEALIVTAQKREEDIQDVPIAISAFTQEQLERSQVAGGPDLITQVPNMTFTKTNFTSYSIQIRGIGTQAISATTDAAVAVAFNNTPFIRNRFFEQEFYDLQRVEVLRGPQGTLYGRNATAGVVNLISAKPKFLYEAKASADVASYNSTRVEGMVNVPLVDDKVALRIAGAWTKREGYSTNEITGSPIDGRDLWSTRLSLRFAPTDSFEANLIWEHFKEDDGRLRSGKQLCDKDVVTSVTAFMPERQGYSLYGGQTVVFPTTMTTPLATGSISQTWQGAQGTFSQGCKPSSLYAPESFQTPNGLSLPFVHPLKSIGVPINDTVPYFDPYASTVQSRDLRTIESTVDPNYQAESDVVELQLSIDVSDHLTVVSETGYNVDTIFSTQDYNRFNTASGVFNQPNIFYDQREELLHEGPVGGIFCDPQIGCADRLVAVDLSTARSRQFSQEVRLSSDYDGAFNFSLGANFLRYDTEDKYYVFINTLGLYAAKSPYASFDFAPYDPQTSDNAECLDFAGPPDFNKVQTVNGCVFIDPNPIGSLNDQGHNYFLSRNPYKLISYALFGETYYQITNQLKVTAGVRWTVDKKEAPRIPSWVIAADSIGYPVAETVTQEWREPTGRLAIDWKPNLGLTDETLLYASYAHGYKAGGMNPPASGVVCYFCGEKTDLAQALAAATHPKTFDPEFIDAFELGAKNTMLDGRLTLNAAAFYYDYQGYQISQIVNRAAVNYNFDAEVWGLEIEADWRPAENLRLGFKGGYENTQVADGTMAVDVMDRTNGDPNWVVVRPFPTFPSNCIVPAWLFVADVPYIAGTENLTDVGLRGTGGVGPCELAYVMGFDPITGREYVPNPTEINAGGVGVYGDSLNWRPGYPGWDPSTAPNHGAGIAKDLSGNELPNAPHFTATITADYTLPLTNSWLATLHTDLYYQSESWARIFNTEGYDKLKAYTNVNLAAIFTNEEHGWKVMAYVKNVFDRANITGAFLNSDDTGLTTNVFMTEPRLYGLRVSKEFTGGPWWTGADPGNAGPFPLTVEVGGQLQRHDAGNERFTAPSIVGVIDELNIENIQDRNFDWGDGRSLRLTYQSAGSPWFVSAGARYGRANATHRGNRQFTTPEYCGWPDLDYYGYNLKHEACDPDGKYYTPDLTNDATNWTYGEMTTREEHKVVDFEAGRDVGLGGVFSRSRIRAGLRYATLNADSSLSMATKDNWTNFIEGWVFKYQNNLLHRVDIDAEREFKGVGPSIAWDGAAAVWANDGGGEARVDWSLGGAVLFGKQKTQIGGQDWTQYYYGHYLMGLQPVGDPTIVDVSSDRSKSATVPVLDLSLGLSYQAGRVNIGAGYRWERYFDALDVGFDEAKDGDRTIDGPYFKLSVGFGG